MKAYQAITTKYHGPTNTRGPRISATSSSGISVSIKLELEWNDTDGHVAAVRALCAKLGWDGKYAAGATKGGFTFVQVLDTELIEIPKP